MEPNKEEILKELLKVLHSSTVTSQRRFNVGYCSFCLNIDYCKDCPFGRVFDICARYTSVWRQIHEKTIVIGGKT